MDIFIGDFAAQTDKITNKDVNQADEWEEIIGVSQIVEQ